MAKKKILDYLNEINVNVFSGQAKVTDWRTQTVEHNHEESELRHSYNWLKTLPRSHPDWEDYRYADYFYHETVEVAELSIPTVGSVFLFKLIGGYWNKKYRDGDQEESRGEIGTSDRVTIFQEVSCSGCRSTQEHSIPFPSLDPGWLALSDYYLGEGKPFEMFSKTHFKEEEDAYGATFSAVHKEITSLHEKL